MGLEQDIVEIKRKFTKLEDLNTPDDPGKVDRIRQNLYIIAHNVHYYKGAWYYRLGAGQLYYTEHKDGHSELYDIDQRPESGKLLRGRLLDYDGVIFCVIYLDPNISPVAKLSENTILDIKFQLERVAKCQIDFVMDDSSNLLIEHSLVEKRSWIDLR